jgi:hypothetical protein
MSIVSPLEKGIMPAPLMSESTGTSLPGKNHVASPTYPSRCSPRSGRFSRRYRRSTFDGPETRCGWVLFGSRRKLTGPPVLPSS